MKKQKKLFIFSGIVICLITITLVIINFVNSDNVIYESDNANASDNRVIGSNALTMMYETEAGSGEYTVASDNTWPQDGYVFNERLSGCENGSKLTWDDERKAVILSTTVSDRCYVYFDVEVITLADYIINEVYTGTDGENGLYYHDADLANGAQDNSYRYSGANPNNYVCFGATGADCQNAENQYRIIGVFNNQVKLIKATSYGSYAWEQDYRVQGNTWNEITKPDIYTTLNTTYYNTLGSEWQNLIAETTWQVGGFNYSDLGTAKETYDLEVGTGQSGYEETMKIGLMYMSDYGYGANPEKWTTDLGSLNYGTDNWLYLGDSEWLITRSTARSDNAFVVYFGNGGYVASDFVDYTRAVRPSFSLTSTVTISSGTGTSSDPFVLDLG